MSESKVKAKTMRISHNKIISIILSMVVVLLNMRSIVLYAAEGDTTWQNEWQFTPNQEVQAIYLMHYNGSAEDYQIPNKAVIEGVEYDVIVAGYNMIYGTPIKNLSFQEGVKLNANTYAIFSSQTLESIDFSGLDFSMVESMSYSFGNNVSLTSIDFSGISMPELTSLSNLFNGCSSLKEIDMSNMNMPNLTKMEKLFYNCTGLESADISNISVPSLENMDSMFAGCTNLEEVDMSNIDANNLKYFSNVFSGCENLTSVNMDNFSAPNIVNANSIFKNCSSIETLKVEGLGTIKANSNIFDGCTLLKNLTFKNIGKICEDAFKENEIIENITIDNVELVESFAFQGSTALKKLTVKDSYLQDGAFSRCQNLTDIKFIGTANEIENGAFYVEPESYRDIYLEYKDNNGEDHYDGYENNIVPVLTTTYVESDDKEIFDYPWAADNRLVTDRKTYTLTYNLNGADGENTTVEFVAGDSVSSQIPERSEYKFYGWNTKKDGTGNLFVPSEKININKDFTLYAQWRKSGYTNEEKTEGWAGEDVKWKYENGTLVFYKVGDGDGRMYNQAMQGVKRYSAPWVAPSKVIFEEGITYIGDFAVVARTFELVLPDSLEEIGEGAFYLSTITHVENLGDDVKVGKNAFYYLEELNTLTADANGGKYEDESTTKEYEVRVSERYADSNRKQEIVEPTKDGDTFIGWNTKPDGSGEYMKDGYFHIIPRDTTVYAMWASDRITVTYDANGGEFSTDSVEVLPYENILDEIPTKDGFIFSEWNTKPDYSGRGYQPGDLLYANQDITLYARWEKPYSIDTEHYKSNQEASVLYYLINRDGTKIKVFGASDNSTATQGDYVEVSVDYLESFFADRLNRDYEEINPPNFGEREYKKLITFLATSVPYNEGGFSDSFFNSEENYDAEAALIRQFASVVLDTRIYTSFAGTYLGRTLDYRFKFVEDNYEKIGDKYDLRVFVGPGVMVGIERRPTIIEVAKKDTNDEAVEGAHLQILDEDGEVVGEWDTTEEIESIEIRPGTYTLRETATPQSGIYVKANDIVFTVDDDGVITVDGEERDSLEMVDDFTKVQISKVDSETGELVTGAVLVLLDNEENEIDRWTTEQTPYYIEKLPVGKYVLVEEEVPEGYEKASNKNFEVKSVSDIQEVIMENTKIKDDPEEDEKEEDPKDDESQETDQNEEQKEEKKEKYAVAPKTGDYIIIAAVSIVVALGLIVAIIVLKKKNNKSDEK